uniref:Uncharacterized protein n=1 Tax=Pyrodinium bahamense TaxID=73915 RepID=A0A7S0A9G8_9DINO
MKAKKVSNSGKKLGSRGLRLLNSKGSIRKALADLVAGNTVTSAAADAAMRSIPPTSRAGYPLTRQAGAPDTRKWKTIAGAPVHVDFTRKPWLPDDWCQGVKRTHGGNTYTVYMPPTEVRTLYHQWQCEEYLGRGLGPADGFAGQMRLARLARQQAPLDPEDVLFNLLGKQEMRHLRNKSAFHFCIISARRATVEGARDIATVQDAFTSAGVIPTWYVDEASLEAYLALDLKAVVGGKLTPARNAALADARQLGKVCVQCSDDLSSWEYREGERAAGKTMDSLNAAHRAAQCYRISPVAAARFILAKMRSCPGESRPRLGGAYILGDCSRTWGGEAFSRKHFILGDFMVVDDSELKFDERLTLKEDYDYCCQHIATHGSVMRCNRMTFTAKHYSNLGGAVDVRDEAGAKEQQNIRILYDKWPNAIFPHRTRKNEVRLHWHTDGKAAEAEGPVRRTATKLHARCADLPANGVLVNTGKGSSAPYIAERVKRAAGRTVAQALASMRFADKTGKKRNYTLADLRYDLSKGALSVKRRACVRGIM